ncbi:MAG: ArsR/SmtB family transcription factor [Candidatus Baldrarchaeia archaeon]
MQELIVEDESVAKIAKALASKTRWQILKLLREKKMDVSRIAEVLNQTEANISAQVKILEKAGLIRSKYEPGEHGVRKVCEPAVEKIVIKIK